MTSTIPAAQPPKEKLRWWHERGPVARLLLRWAYIAVLTVVAFHATIANLAETIRNGGINSYLLVVPLASVVAAVGVARRERNELPIHDRQTDVIVGSMGLVLALLVQAVLLERYVLYFHLLRLDLVAMWMFVLSSSIVLFGLRPIFRFRWVWALLLAVFPLPYQITTILLGGDAVAAGGATVLFAAAAAAVAVGRSRGRALLGWIAAWGVGLLLLGVMAMLTPDASLLVFQLVPALTSLIAVAIAMYFHARRGTPKRVLDRTVEPLAARQVWAGVPLVLVFAIALAFVPLPARAIPFSQFDNMKIGAPLLAPDGWHQTEVREYDWVEKVYGPNSTLVRQKFVADTGRPQWDKFSRSRTVVVDSVTTHRPYAFETYPTVVLYHVAAVRMSASRWTDLGHDVGGELVGVVDDGALITWNTMKFTWTNGKVAQQVVVFAVDNHEPDAPFPRPTGRLLATLGTMFTVLLRGNSVATDTTPVYKDADLLTEFSRALVDAQVRPLGGQ